jgi:protein phosphatase 2C family protein 2/3
MDMDQRTRMLGGRAGRVILLGDGTEVVTGHGDDDDIDMDDHEVEEVEDSDVEEQIKKGQDAATSNGEKDDERLKREETPAPTAGTGGVSEPSEKLESSDATVGTSTPEEPKMMAVSDGRAE